MKISNLFNTAHNFLNKAECSLQNIFIHLKFKNFNDYDMPNISCNINNAKIFLEWRGNELDEDSIINIIENQEYITPEDFDKN